VLTAARAGDVWKDEGNGRIRVTDPAGTAEIYERVPASKPSVEETMDLTGVYTSDEGEVTLVAGVEDQSLVLKRRPDTVIKLKPVYKDAFDAPHLGLVIFRRDSSGHVIGLTVNQDRVWDLRFTRSCCAH
jgi:hypothetical protein